MTTAAIVQARYGSSRLPGKVLEELDGRPVICHVLERCRRIPDVDVVVCAVPAQPASNEIESYAISSGAEVFRGPEHDVLARTLGAARSVAADTIVRVTSDCPLIDPEICGEVLTALIDNKADYACNNNPRCFPLGLDCEAFTASALVLADEATKASRYDREHVTPYIRRSTSGFNCVSIGNTDYAPFSYMRWTLDYPEDLAFFRAIYMHGQPESVADVLMILHENPEIEDINREIGRET